MLGRLGRGRLLRRGRATWTATSTDDADFEPDGEVDGDGEPDGVVVTDGVGVGVGVLDGLGFGPFFSAAATAAWYAASVGEESSLPFTRTVGVDVMPSLLARSVIASTSGTCFSFSTQLDRSQRGRRWAARPGRRASRAARSDSPLLSSAGWTALVNSTL